MSAAAGARKRLSVGAVAGGGLFALGCGCRDAKAVAVASSASPYSAATAATETTTSTATTATWRGARTPPHRPSSASGSTGTLTVPSASSSSSFPWEHADAGAEGDGVTGEEVDCKGEAATASFSGLLRQLNELEQSVVSWGRKTASKDYMSPPPRPLPALPAKQRVAHSRGGDSKEGHGNFFPPPPPSQFQITQQRRKVKSMDKADSQVEVVHSKQPQPQPPPPPPPPPLPFPPEQHLKAQSTDDKGGKKEGANMFPTQQAPNHRKSKSCDAAPRPGPVRLDVSVGVGVAVVKQSDDPLSDFRRSMVNMIVENRIVTGEELRELLRHFLALNAPRHHQAILAAFTEIWDEAFSANTAHGRREPVAARTTTMATRPRPRPRAPTPPRRRRAPPPRSWR